MSIYNNKKELLNLLQIRDNFLYDDFSNKFYQKLMAKKNGGIRTINPPTKKLKKVQKIILKEILVKFPHLPCVYGLSADRNILANATFHQGNAAGYLLSLDIKDFFPSVSYRQIIGVFQEMGFNKELSKILTKLCTFNKCLPQGAPTSSYLACLSLRAMDKEIYGFCKLHGLLYTRYIDDITISGKEISEATALYIKNTIQSHGHNTNTKESLSPPNEEKVINSIVISKEYLSILPGYLASIQKAYQEYLAQRDTTSHTRFIGKLGFYTYINQVEAENFYKQIVNL